MASLGSRLIPRDSLSPEMPAVGRFEARAEGRAFALQREAGAIALSILAGEHVESTVGEQLLRLPSGVKTISGSEPRFEAAQNAAILDWEARGRGSYSEVAEDEYRVLIRGRFTDSEVLETLLLDNGAEIWIPNYYGPPVGELWGVLEFRVHQLAESPPEMFADLVWAIPASSTPLVLPTYGEYLAVDFGSRLLAEWLLDRLDLSCCGLRDPVSTLQFLRRAHAGEVLSIEPPGALEEGSDFAARVELMMVASGRPTAVSLSSVPRRLVKTASDAEANAANFMRSLGFDAATTPPGADGGVDVLSPEAVAQVKMEGVATGRPAIQALFGVASVEQKIALFFSLAGYSAQAIEWAERAGVACFEFAYDGSIEPRTRGAEMLVEVAQRQSTPAVAR